MAAEAAAELANRYGQSLIACTFLSSVYFRAVWSCLGKFRMNWYKLRLGICSYFLAGLFNCKWCGVWILHLQRLTPNLLLQKEKKELVNVKNANGWV